MEAGASPAHTALTTALAGGKAALYGFTVTSLPWSVRWVGGKVDTEQSSCSGSFLRSASPSVSIFMWKIFHVLPRRRDTAGLQNIAPESCREINVCNEVIKMGFV